MPKLFGFLALSANALPLRVCLFIFQVCCTVVLLVIQERTYHRVKPEDRKHKGLMRLRTAETGVHGFPFASCLLRGQGRTEFAVKRECSVPLKSLPFPENCFLRLSLLVVAVYP